MRYLFQRVVHNGNDWMQPSPDRLSFTGDGGYLEENGFGHEDWNFSPDPAINGYVHGYMYYSPKSQIGPFNILFATYDKGEGWALAGYYRNAEFEPDGASFPPKLLLKRAEELRKLDKLGSLGGHYKGKTVAQITKLLEGETQHYRWRVLPKDVHRLQTPLRLPPSLAGRFGKYFTTATSMEKESWDAILEFAKEFVGKPTLDDFSDGGDTEFPEGAVYEAKHKARERNQALVKLVKANFLAKHGRLYCEACDFDFVKKYGQAGNGFIEAHHTIFVSDLTSGAKTKVSDMVLVCSNCHRILHRKRPWLSIPALRKLLKGVASKKLANT